MIITIIKLYLPVGFQDFFNFFKALAQIQRFYTIIHLLDEFFIRDLYKHHLVGTHSVVSCFDRFFAIGHNLRISDAILYACYRDIIFVFGNTDPHLTEVDRLASNGHFSYMVAKFTLGIFYSNKNSSACTLHSLVYFYKHPHYRRNIFLVLTFQHN